MTKLTLPGIILTVLIVFSSVIFTRYTSAGGAFVNQLVGGNGYAQGYGVVITKDDSVIGTGNFNNTLDLTPYGGTLLASTAGQDVYVTSFDSAGQSLWDLSFGGGCDDGNCDDQGRSIAQDQNGNSIVTGHYIGPLTYGSSTLPAYGEQDIFVAKIDATGGLVWLIAAGGRGEDFGRDVAVDSNNNIYVTGSIQGKAKFGSTIITPSGSSRTAFLAKYDPSGSLIYVKTGDSLFDGYGTSVAVNSQDDVVWSTICYNDITFDSITLMGGSSYDVCLVAHNASGTIQWAVREGGTLEDEATALAIDPYDNIVVVGRFKGNPIFSNQSLSGDNWWYNSFVAKYDVAGILQWVKQSHVVHAPGGVHPNAVTLFTPLQDVIRFAGSYGGEVLFESTPLPISSGNDDAFIIELDGSGMVLSTEIGAGSNTDTIYGLANHVSSDRTALSGYFFDNLTFTFNPSTMNAGNTADAFIGSY